ncbi:ABC transporter ATP-binding protein [Odoribacter sp. OttesenSCG-928-L07]|nr:ABC transporter ATP-binding protein [Odoribacter sp. OttesenSCG-928-L07]MDL2239514.1 ABC transporter ATP-binding protein [Bacteroidales bacterium OttesenSCG-928-L14]
MIEIKNLKFGYDKKKLLFNDLNLNLSQGKIYGLLGRNGTGKTTLLKIIMGLRFPKSGTCNVFGLESKKRLPSMLEQIMFVPEEVYTPDIRIWEYEASYSSLYPNFNYVKFDNFLQEFELQKTDKLKSLSLGQKKKAVLAFAMAASTKLLILDEPTNGLDIPSKSQFRKIVASLATDENCIIISTHQAQDVEKLIDSVIILDDGNILLQSTTEEISEKLAIEISSEVLPQAIYCEERLGGVYNVTKNIYNEPTEFNLELFFNAVMANKQVMIDLFNTKKQ